MRGGGGWLVLLLVTALPVPAAATTFVVDSNDTTTGDATPGDGICSAGRIGCTLPAAIEEANALAGDDDITLPADTYEPTATLPSVTSVITITGAGAATTIIRAADPTRPRLFNVTAGHLTLDGVTLANAAPSGVTGSAILADDANVTIRNAIISDNEKRAVQIAGGTLIVFDSTFATNTSDADTTGAAIHVGAGATLVARNVQFSGNTSQSDGGAVFLDAEATSGTFTDCTFTRNGAAGRGGAISSGAGSLTIGTSTFVSNSVDDGSGPGGGAVWAAGSTIIGDTTFTDNSATGPSGVPGGALAVLANATCTGCTFARNSSNTDGSAVTVAGTFLAVNSTFSGNTGGRAIALGSGSVDLSSCTVTANAAGIPSGTALRNSIVAGNGDAATTGPDCTGTVGSQGYNLIGTDNDCAGLDATDLAGTPAAPLDPGLGSLASNGGPTETHALLATSPAGEAGNPGGCRDSTGAVLATDQRGQPRTIDGDGDGTARCDIGAYEAPTGTFPPPSTTTTSTSTSSTTLPTTTSTSTSTSTTATSTTTTTASSTTTTTFFVPALYLPCLIPDDDSQPVTLVSSGVTDYRLRGETVFWHDAADCPGAPPLDAERMRRRPVTCGIARTIFQEDPGRVGCGSYDVHSTIVADDTHLYWVDDTGLVRLPVGANPGDPTELVNDGIAPSPVGTKIELAILGDAVYALRDTGNIVNTHTIVRLPKDGALASIAYQANAALGRLSADGEFLYWLQQGNLKRRDPDAAPGVAVTLTGGVTAYFADGRRLVCALNGCFYTKYVFIAKGAQVYRWNNVGDTLGNAIFTSTGLGDEVYDLTSEGTKVYLLETHTPLGGARSVYLIRMGRGGSDPDIIWAREGVAPGEEPGPMSSVKVELASFVVWQDAAKLYRLAGDAPELPLADLSFSNVEVTQAIQDFSHSVPLIKKKKTFVRAFLKSAGPATPGVTARLYGTWTGGSGGPLYPLNDIGMKLTAQPSPSRDDINHSFIFGMPSSWTTKTNLVLTVVLNPDHYPLESSYANNTKVTGPYTFENSPRLQVQFVAWGYEQGGNVYYPRFVKDIVQTYSWVRRVYPLASTSGFADDPSPGFRPNLWFVFDDALGARVNRTHPSCQQLVDANAIEGLSLCASYYTNVQMHAMRFEECLGLSFWDLLDCIIEASNPKIFMYGMISDSWKFPRGQACCAPKVSSGPTGVACCGSDEWDDDGSYADWYAGHEIGHTLGRAHPAKGTSCGHSASDPNYPYNGALIGPSGGSLAGFDVGDGDLDIARQVYSRKDWADVMSYCPRQWISDYTYEAMLDFMNAAANDAALARGARASGDFLIAIGSIGAAGDTAFLDILRRVTDPPGTPPAQTGTHHLQLLDENGMVLGDHPLATEPIENESGIGGSSFAHVVPFAAGTRLVRVLDGANNVLGSRAVSANAPVITAVGLEPPPAGPVAGTVTLAWTASDPDGDPLTFDLFYSLNDGASFQPLRMNAPGPSAMIDTDALGGGTAILRVTASDGVLTGSADTPPFEVAKKPPRPHIIDPADGTHLEYGHQVTLLGEADDLQQGTIPDDDLVWSSQDGPLGTGAELPLENLPVGENVITLAATNADGLSAATSVTVVVGDDPGLPGPILSAAPMPVGWSVPVGSGPVTADIDITNVGGGTVTWTAADDAPWLALGAAAGAVPATLQLTADPSGVPDGTSLRATLTLQALDPDGQPVETLEVPVRLTVGNIWDREGPAPSTTTTTTTLPPAACSPPDCDDGDACTRDTCVDGMRCANDPIGGFEGAKCVCSAPLPEVCADEKVPKGVRAKLAKACKLIGRAADQEKVKRRRSLLKRASKALKGATRRAAKAGKGKKPRLTAECVETLEALFGDLRARTGALRP